MSQTLSGGASGSGAVSYKVTANNGPQRSGTISIGGQTFTVNQDSGCAFDIIPLTPDPADFAAVGGSGTFSVTASNSLCPWTAESNAPSWLLTTVGGMGTSLGAYSVSPNLDEPRSALINLGALSFTINQAAGCAYIFSPQSQAVPSTGGSFSISVTPNSPDCAWSASSEDDWISDIAGSAAGSGVVTYSVSPNAGPESEGIIDIGGQAFTVTQASGCIFTITHEGMIDPFPSTGGAGAFSITTSDDFCSWTVESSAPSWLITTGSGTGTGSVVYTVSPNLGEPRSAVVNLGAQSFTINQAAGCAYVLSPSNQAVPAEGGSFGIDVTANSPDCAWTASSQADWVTSVSGSATGNGVVTYSVLPNTGPESAGIIDIGGQAFTVTRKSGCAFTITPDGFIPLPSTGGSGTFTVTASDSLCPWTVEAGDPLWLITTAGGTGPGSGAYKVEPNLGIPRTSAVSLGAQSFTVNQDSGCAYVFSPPGRIVPEGGGSFSIGVKANSPGCTWKATSGNDWITQVSGSATGNGVVTYSVLPNTGTESAGAIYIDGQAFSVTQIEAKTTLITASCSPGGEMSPEGEVAALAGSALTFYMYPDPGFFVMDVLVDGQSMGPMNSLTLMNLQEKHTIHAIFGN